VPDESSRHAAAAEVFGNTWLGNAWLETPGSAPWLARERSWLRAIDDLERGDNRPSLAARIALELHPEIGLDELLAVCARVVAENQVILRGLVHGGRQNRVDFSGGRVFCGEGCVSAVPVEKL
jgi:hypothetical protein